MSWSISFVGTPQNVAAAVEGYAPQLSGGSRAEYEKVAPSIVNLIRQNHANPEAGYVGRLILVRAAGTAAADKAGVPLSGTCKVTVENIDAQPV